MDLYWKLLRKALATASMMSYFVTFGYYTRYFAACAMWLSENDAIV